MYYKTMQDNQNKKYNSKYNKIRRYHRDIKAGITREMQFW